MTPRNITPLTPLTPLRWKSNPQEQEKEEKPMERSRLSSAVSYGMPPEEYPGGKLAANNGKEERSAEGRQQGALVAGSAVYDQTQAVDELSTKAQAGNVDEIVSLEFPEGPDRYCRGVILLVSLSRVSLLALNWLVNILRASCK